MSYFHCRNGHHDDCNGYIGPLDTYSCGCECHTAGSEGGTRIVDHT